MERSIESAKQQPDQAGAAPSGSDRVEAEHASGSVSAIAAGPVDMRSVLCALVGGAGYFILAAACIALSRFDSALASVWLPNASAVSLLLLARPRNELPTYAALAAACFSANIWTGNAPMVATIFVVGNLVEITLTTWLVRRFCGVRPDLTDLASLGRFLQIACVAGPLASAMLVAPALGSDAATIWSGILGWFLADSMGMILVVPAALLIADEHRLARRASSADLAENALLMTGGLLSVYFVFKQDLYPLLFLTPPVTLLIAFRLGGLGTAMFVPGVAILSSWLTYSGVGPIVNNSTSDLDQTYLIQAFTAVNFVTGLPIAAILAGRVRLTRELRQERSEVALLTENITDAVLRLDPKGTCTYASPSVQEVLGRPPEDFIGKPVASRTHKEAHDEIAGVLDRLLSGVSVKERFTYRRLLDREDGRPAFIEADCAIVTDPDTGARDGIVVSARDVTGRVELERELTRARTTAEKAANTKSEFLANMSHEIRTPMNGVLGFAELMLQGELDEENRRHTKMIVQSGRSMMLLLNDILDLSKIEAGQIAIDQQPVDLWATIAECVSLHRPTAESKGLELIVDVPPTTSEGQSGDRDSGRVRSWVMTDGLRLRQIVLNLIGNAVKFTEKGSVTIRIETREDEFSVEVRDTGIGISESGLDAIFAPFTQGESDTARRFGGTGLGLTISRQLADLLGGTIDVDSALGEGSAFRLRLPAVYVDEAPVAPQEFDEVEPADLPQSSRILLVEDHDVNRLLGTEMLERCGQRVDIAHDGNEAIAMVIDSVMRAKPYDLIFMDIQMPGCDGYAATRAIRAEGIGPDMMPIVALTANAFPEDIAAARKAGMQAHLSKPLVFAELARALQRWLPTRIVEHSGEASDGTRDEDRIHPPKPQERHHRRRATDTLGTTMIRKGQPQPQEDTPAPATPTLQPQTHSPALLARWNERRSEAIEEVRKALANGDLSEAEPPAEAFDRLARLVHKLAGTAGIFGEPELGEQAAAFERALRTPLDPKTLERMAFELLSVADDPADRRASA
ncbi:MAG: ATP-binding protein [Erythrobacter sp.]